MPTSEIILFKYGFEGGGATVYRYQNNKVIEKGRSGGILDEEEDPFKTWEEIYDILTCFNNSEFKIQ